LTQEQFSEERQSTPQHEDSINALRDRVTIVIPTLNEEEAIGPLIDEIKEAGYRRILVVDGYSKDKTVMIASDKGAKVVGQHGRGKTGAVLVARDIVDTPYFLLMDGDYSYDPKDIDKFVRHSNGYDHIIGFRPKDSPHISRTHKIGNWILTKTFNLLMGSNVPDVACGMYLMKTEKVKQLILDRQGFEIDQEIAAQMLLDGKVTYVPINYRARLGKAKAPTWRQGFRALFAIIGLALRYNPVLLFSVLASFILIPAFMLLFYAIYLYFFFHAYHGGYFLASLVLFVLGAQGFTVSTIAVMLRRIERKLNSLGKNN
jgi:glycosyltransferase involved in cell wall biosynthesis